MRRVAEVAGMVHHCDFEEQKTVQTADGALRPDMVVRLAGGKNVVVDSKVSLAAYLEAVESEDPVVREERLVAHARHLRKHVDDLAGKAYWTQFTPSPEFVVLFVPGEAFLAPALDRDPQLLEYAAAKHVILATPTTLIATLRTVAYAWQQDRLADNAQAVIDLGKSLYSRLATMGGHVSELGRALGTAVGKYNETVGSLEGRVFVTARKLADMRLVEADLIAPTPLDITPRAIQAPELVASASDALIALPDSTARRDDDGPTLNDLDEVGPRSAVRS